MLRLNKALYGLKQAPQAWNDTLISFLCSIKFRRCEAEPCLLWRTGTFLYIHVDDIAVFSKEPDLFVDQLKSRFDIKDLGRADLLLGMKVTQETDHITLSQSHYVDTLLNKMNINHLPPSKTPMKLHTKLIAATKDERNSFDALKVNFRAAIGALNYLSCTTRPYISFAVGCLSQFLSKPGIKHWDACIQVFQYLKGTKEYCLKISKQKNFDSLIGYSDADWGNCKQTRRSISGYVIEWNGSVIAWKLKKQSTVATSSAQAEYQAISDLVKEVMWMKIILKKCFNIKMKVPTTIYEDNKSAIDLANNNANHSSFRTKHMSIKYHFIRQEIKLKHIQLQYIKSENMLADFLTKPVGKTIFSRTIQALNLSAQRLKVIDQGGVLNYQA